MPDPSPSSTDASVEKPLTGWRLRWYTVIFEADTRAGRFFDKALIAIILFSIAVVMADSVESINLAHGRVLSGLEWIFTLLFSAEYIARPPALHPQALALCHQLLRHH